jgi:hypothetical protein
MEFKDNLWRKDNRIVLPGDPKVKQAVIAEHHDCPFAAHRGVEKTKERILRHFWWPHLAADIQEYVSTCPDCQRNKPSNQLTPGLLQPLPIPSRRWDQVTMDLITSLPTTSAGYDSVFVVVDRLSKAARFIPCRTAGDAVFTAVDAAKLFVKHVVCDFGMPATIIADRDVRWHGNFWQALCSRLGTRLSLSTAYHPQTDGQTERTNRTLEEMLRNYVNDQQDDWDELLPLIQFAYNDSQSATTNHTPFFLLYGEHPRSPLTAALQHDDQVPAAADFVKNIRQNLALAKQHIAKAQQRQKAAADKRRRALTFQVGETVSLSTANLKWPTGSKKLTAKWIQVPVTRVISPVAYELQLPARWKCHNVFHVSLLRPFKTSDVFTGRDYARPAPELVDDGEEFEVDRIIAERHIGRGRSARVEYLVRWKGYPPEDDTWQPVASLVNAPDVLQTWRDGSHA